MQKIKYNEDEYYTSLTNDVQCFIDENINTRIRDYTYLPFIILLLLQVANKSDISRLLLNCRNEVKSNNRCYDFCFAQIKYCPKEFIMHLFVYDWMDNISRNPLFHLQDMLVKHLNAIAACYRSYGFMFFEETKEDKKYIKVPMIDKVHNSKFWNFNEKLDINKLYNARSIKKEYLEKFFHEIINNYTENKFYYEFFSNEVNKIEFEYDENGEACNYILTPFKLVDGTTNPYILQEETGLKFYIGKPIVDAFEPKNGIITPKPCSYNSFKRTNVRILKALTYVPEYCHWCNPNKDIHNEKGKCGNCRSLLDELNSIKSNSVNKETKKINFNALINSIGNKNYNTAELRIERRKQLYSIINKEDAFNLTKEELKNIKKLIDRSFTVEFH